MSLKEAILQSFEGSSHGNPAEDILNNRFLNNRVAWTNEVINGYMKHGSDMNLAIAKIASANKLNNDQVMRIVEEANVGVYLQKYAQTRGQRVRRVSFDLADPMKIGVMTPGATSSKVATDAEVETLLAKVASAGREGYSQISFELGEKKANDMFINDSSNYDYSIWDSDARDKCASEMIKRRVQEKIEAGKIEKIAALRGMLNDLSYVGNALIYNERAKGTGQQLFNKLASDTSLNDKAQGAVIRYVQEKVASLKGERFLPGNFEFSLVESTPEVNKFSLGSHSLMKSAGTDDARANNQILEQLSLPNGVDYAKLVNITQAIADKVDESGKVNIYAGQE